ncbi:MAG: hypothetical protein Q4A06_05355 [Cardiobacteriaceae bacterium]|nr:hypothetical protein [Cardiobacteriaceae bacterium]
MGQIHSYYRILGLEATASASEIQSAIQSMREIDTEGNYSAILNKIEKTLLPRSRRTPESGPPILDPVKSRRKVATPPRPRREITAELFEEFTLETPSLQSHADFLEENKIRHTDIVADANHESSMPEQRSGFLDFGEKDFLTEPQRKNNQPLRDHRTYITEEEIQSYNRPPSFLAKIFSGKNLIISSLGIALLVAGAIAGLPAYQLYLANKQSEEAMPVLVAARNDAAELVRKNGYFPDSLSRDFSGEYYTVRLDSAKEAVELTFNHNAADNLQGHSLIMSSYVAPNLGLQWRCDISSAYPKNLRPAQCF